MNPSFVLVLKSERCIDISRQLSFLVECDTKIANLKVNENTSRAQKNKQK